MHEITKSIDKWRAGFKKQRIELLKKLLGLGKTKEEILGFFLFDNMKEKEEDFCPLYKKDIMCHKTKSLNCYGCDCPFYEPSILPKDADGNNYIGKCLANSKKARYAKHSKKANLFILDCSKCTLPHTSKYSRGFIENDVKELKAHK